jgi:hypothetical protein
LRDSAGSLAMFTAMRHARDTGLFRRAAAKSVTDPPPWGVIPFLTVLRMGLMTIDIVRERLKTLRRTKLYDLCAAALLVAWYGFCAAQVLPLVAQQIELVKLFVQTDPSVLPAALVLSTVAHVATLAFFAILVVLFAVRHVAQRTAPGFYPRFAAVAGTFLGVGFLLLPLQELSYALYLGSVLSIIGGTGLAIYAALVLGRSISILPEARRLVTFSLSQVEVRCLSCHSCLLTALGHVLWRGICSEATNAHESFSGISLGAPLFDQRKRRWGVRVYHSTRPRKRSCVSITDNSSCARFKPARPRSGSRLRSLSIRRSAAATRSRARSRSVTVYCRGSGRVRFFRGPFAVLLARMATLCCFQVPIVPLNRHLAR